jgi:hypothetical protein
LARKRKPSDIEVISNWLALLLVLGLVFASITVVGDLLGLTPSVDEMTDRPDGWVGRNYEGIVVGYALTALFLAVVIVGAWLAIRTQSRVTQQADVARYLLPRVGWFGAALLVAIAVVPVGKRANVEGDVPKLVGMSAAEAAGELEDASLRANFREDPLVDERCRVVEQSPRPGTNAAEVVTVSLRCAIRVPRVVGRKAVLAEMRLSDLGFEARFVNRPRHFDLYRCRVRGQSRIGAAPPSSRVSLRVRCPEPHP